MSEGTLTQDMLEQVFVHNITVGNLQSPMEFWSWMKALSWKAPPNLALSLRYEFPTDTGLWISDRQQYELRQELTQAVKSAWRSLLLNWHEQNECIILLSVSYELDKTQVEETAKKLLQTATVLQDAQLSIGTSPVIDTPALLTSAVRKARAAALYAAKQATKLAHSDDMELSSSDKPITAAEEDNLETAIASVQRTLAAVQTRESEALDNRKREVLDSLVQLLNNCREQGLPADDELLHNTSLFQSLLEVNSPQKLSLWIETSGFTFLERVAELVDQTRSAVIEKSIQYIVSHLHEELSLENIARHCSVSHYYLSHLFRKETGSTVTAFVRKARMERALWLLGDSGQTVANIAYQVGFQDPNYFSKTFRTYFGKSPSEFRRLL
ncbi:helix-turn-helix transcriptional regulator [Alicyclobacillus sp. SO9]|uniref:helix-turn-helix transcriptional regulator n=1 Tax=Alicyclobacillus sp. SO9 TaxID=2665646 RepID=UPI0018E844E7|nr:AraC family transcriptional regulator [Alicyclobacillus sp. SO9]QQE79279.1 helix-turn-helix transcriptional regulator [Alicyclobacillus sp. SO9]